MTNIMIKCPSCGKTGKVEVSQEAIKNVMRGLLAINISSEIICTHSFITYVDRNLQVRDYFVADFHVEIPEIAASKKLKDAIIPGKEIFDIDLIKLNLPATLITYIIKSIFSNQKIVIISNDNFLYNHILNFFKYITHDTFDSNISITTEEDYKKNKKLYKDSMVFHGTYILKNHQKIIFTRKLWVEKEIVSKFMSESELRYSYIVLKNEIQKAFELSEAIFNILQESKKEEIPNILKITSKLEEIYEIKISTHYINFLIEIVKNYFGISVPSVNESFLDILGK